MLFSRKISILAICTLIATIPATSFADGKIKDPEVGTIDMPSKATSNAGSPTTVLSRHYIDRLHVNGAQISNEDINVANNLRFYGTGNGANSDATKTVSIPSITKLEAGQVIVVKPATTSASISSGMKLKLNDFNAYQIKYAGSNVGTSYYATVWTANVPVTFVFDGTNWVFAGKGYDTTYTSMTQAEITAASPSTNARLVTPQLLRQNLARRPQNAAVGSATKPVYVASDGMVTEVTHELNADVPSTAVFTDTVTTVKNSDGTDGASTAADGSVQVTKDGTTTYPVVQGWASKENVSNKVKQGTSTTSIFSNTSTDDEYPSAKAVYTALNAQSTDISGKQDKDNNEIYKVGYNGDWTDLSTAVTVDTTYLKNSNSSNTNKSVQVAIDTSKMTTSGTSGLSNSSTKLVQEKAIAQALALKQNKLPYDATPNLIIAPTTDGGEATKRAITLEGAGITGLASSSDTGVKNIPTAWAVKEAITSATNAADISDHTVNGAPLSNEATYYYGTGAGGATSTAKTVQINSITTAPTAGMTIVVNPATTATSGTSMTLNLNGTGAKAVKYEGSTTLTNEKSAAIWKKDVPVVFVYDGTNWLYEGNKYIAGTGITVSGSVITNTGVRSVATGTGNDGTISVNTNGTPADVAVKGWNKTVKYDGTNAVGSLTKGVWVDTDGTVKAMTHSVNADVPSTAVFTDTVTTVKNSDGTDGASTAADGSVQVTKDGTTTYPVVQGWANKQNKNTVDHYSVNKNGTWLDASDAITADETYLTETANATDGSTQIGIKTANLASAKANITDLTSSSTDANKGKLTTAYAVKQSLDDKQNKLPYDATANLIIAPTTDGGNATKRAIATAGTDITGLTSSSTDANKIKIPTAYAVKQGLDGKQQKITYSTTNKVVITPTTDGGATGTRDITTAGANITGLASSSATGATNIPTAYAVKEAIGTATSGMITDVSGKQDKDNNEVYKVGYNGGWAELGTTLDTNATGYDADNTVKASVIANALAGKQAKDTVNKYHVSKNGEWVNASGAVTVDTTYLKKTDNTDGSVKVEVDASKLASANANITGLTSSSTAADKGKLTTAWAVNQAIDNDINHFAKSHFVNAAPLLNENSVYWGMSATSDSTAAKTVRIDSLEQVAINPGVFVIITPKATTNVPISTLNVNDSGAFPISYNGSTTISAADSSKIWKMGVPSMFVLDANKEWEYVGFDTDTTYTQGSGITISGTTINNAGVRDIKNPDNTTASTTIADGTIRANIDGTVRYPKVRGWDKTVKYDGTNAVGSATKGVYVNASGVVTEMTHSVNADVPSTAEFTDTTYTFATGTDSGTISVTPEGGSAYNVTVKDAEVTTHKLAQGDATGTVITSSATDTQYPSALAVYNAITSATNAADISGHTVNGAPLSNEASYYYGSGVGGATSTAKTVQINSITTAPTAGMTIVVNPATTATSGTSMTLNLNGTGAKAVKYEGSTTLTNDKSAAIWKKDVPVVFVYDGNNWLYEGNKYIAGSGITVSGSTITNTGVRSVATGTGNDGTISVNTNGTSADVAVKGWANKQNKPATAEVAAGKVLTYNGTGDANGTNNYSAKYIQVPVANNAPNGSNVTVSTLADIWVE